MYLNKQILVTECNICNIHKRNRDLFVKKRIKTRRLTNIYHSDDDVVGDGYNLLSPPLSLSLSLSLPLPLPKTAVSSHNGLIFSSTVFRVALDIGYSQKRISLTLLLL